MAERQVLFVADVAERLGMTEAAVRGAIRRGQWSAVPRPFRLGVRRLAWLQSDLDEWLVQRSRSARVGRRGVG